MEEWNINIIKRDLQAKDKVWCGDLTGLSKDYIR
jgi:hypothetical protein